jgi:L-asparaginase
MSRPFIRIITAGGTIDKIYFDAKSEYQVGEPNVQIVLNEFKMSFDFTVESVVKKDSLDMTDEDRETIAQAILSKPCECVMITHGTDTMVETAAYLASHEASKGKTVVLTGALAPAMFRSSDATFNIGCAITAVQTLAPGVYVAMNGRVFPYDTVR